MFKFTNLIKIMAECPDHKMIYLNTIFDGMKPVEDVYFCRNCSKREIRSVLKS